MTSINAQTDAHNMLFELTLLIDALPCLAWSAFPDGQTEFINQRWLEYTGLTVDQVADHGWIEAVHPDDRKRVGDYWRSCITSQSSGGTEARLRRRDGTYRRFLFHANSVHDAASAIVRWIGINVDVEDRGHDKRAHQSHEPNLSQIINTIPAHIYVLNLEGGVQYVNQAVTDYTGLAMEDVQQEDYRDRVIHLEDLEKVRAPRAAGLRSAVPFTTEQRVLGNDGQYRWYLVRYKPLLDEHGRVVRWYVAAFDIEDRKRAVDRLQLLASMIDSIPASVWSVTPDGTPDVVNQGWYDYTGITPEYVHSHPGAWLTPMHPDDAEAAGKTYWDGIQSGSGFTTEARFLRALDGTYRWHLNRAVAVRDPANNITRLVITSTDIEDLKIAQEELHQARAALAHVTRVTAMGELTASIAHEINQPLAGIITNANTCLRMLAADQPNVEGARETARRTIRDADRVSEVIAHLRALFAKKEVAIDPFDLTEATEEVIAMCSSDMQRKETLIRTDFADGLPIVFGDRIQLQQVILNLLTNAADAMLTVDGRSREIHIKTELDADDLVRVTVRDTGVGFNSADADKLFRAFFTTKSHGMGIGLSVSRSIIESHHGRIWAIKNDGPGATFTFAIPHGFAPTG